MKTRLHFIDIARALAMLSIVLVHSVAYSTHCYEIYRFIFAFCVPLFFILSGYTFRVKNNESFWQFLKHKFLRIMLPYFVWAIIFLIPYFLFGDDPLSLGSSLLGILYGNGIGDALKQNTPLWFLPALFVTEIFYYFIVKYLHRPKTKSIILVASLLIGFVAASLLKGIYLPWGINSALQIGVFFYIGFIIKDQEFDSLSLIILTTIGILAYCFNSYDNVIWAEYIYNNYFLTFVSGTAFSILVIELAKLINKNKVLEYVGKNTMSILIFHKIIIYFCQFRLGVISEWLQNSSPFAELGLAITIGAFAILFSLFADWLLTKMRLKALLGKS